MGTPCPGTGDSMSIRHLAFHPIGSILMHRARTVTLASPASLQAVSRPDLSVATGATGATGPTQRGVPGADARYTRYGIMPLTRMTVDPLPRRFPRTVWIASLGALWFLGAPVPAAGQEQIRTIQAQLARGALAEAAAGADRLRAELRPANRSDSLVILDATAISIEARQRMNRNDDPALPELIESLLVQCRRLLPADALELARAHQYAGFLARAQDRPEEELRHLEQALEVVERGKPPIPAEHAKALGNLAGTCFRRGDATRSRDLLERALGVLEAQPPADRIEIAPTLVNLNEVRIAQGDTAGVAAAYDRAARIYEMHQGPGGAPLADVLRRKGTWLLDLGQVTTAASLLERATTILGTRDPNGEPFAASLLARAQVQLASGEVDSAAALSFRARVAYAAIYGAEAPELAACLITSGDAHRRMFRHDEAAAEYREALAILERSAVKDVPTTVNCLQALAAHALELGRYPEAEGFARRALDVTAGRWGPRHPKTARARLQYGAALRSSQQPDSARAQYLRALSDLAPAAVAGDPAIPLAHLRLAALASDRGDLAEARTDVDLALALLEGTGSPQLAEGLQELGILQRRLGDFAGARVSLERALSVAPDPARQSAILNSLGALERSLGRSAEALARFQDARFILQRALPVGHPQHALVLRNLASLQNASGQYAEAEGLLRSALGALELTVGPDHPDVAATHLGLGNALKEQGKTEEARAHYLRAIEIHRSALGPDAPALALDHHNLAALQLQLGRLQEAMDSAGEAERIGRQHFRLIAQGVSEREALHYSAGRVAGTDIILTAAARTDAPADWERAWDLVIQSRALVLEEISFRRAFSNAARDPITSRLRDDLRSASDELAFLAVRGRGLETKEQYGARLAAARLKREAAERALAARSKEFAARQALQSARLGQVLASLPPQSALIAWVRFDRLERPEDGMAGRPAGPPRGEPFYAAFVARAEDPGIRFVPLETAREVEQRIAVWHEQAGSDPRERGPDSEADYLRAGEALRRAVWDPVAGSLERMQQVFLVPDGALALVNFDALPAESGGFLLEQAPLLHLLSSERELVRAESQTNRGEGLLTVAAPDYDLLPSGPPAASSEDDPVKRGSPCGQYKSLLFAPLPATAAEKDEVMRLWDSHGRPPSAGSKAKADELVGATATERNFKRLARGRQVIHTATHGFFLGAECAGRRAGSGLSAPDELTVGNVVAESPLLLSGLAFGGANQREQAETADDDGILTAEEITTLDLQGVDWVVLSACETGLGRIEAGEGVFGLRRAFQVAGARNLVMTLWSVDDQATALWMAALFESRLRRGLSVPEAVRAASLAILQSRRAAGTTTHPYFWGAFVATGSWR